MFVSIFIIVGSTFAMYYTIQYFQYGGQPSQYEIDAWIEFNVYTFYKPESENLFIQVFRHARRTPADTYPNDPHINDTLTPYGWGQLTNVNINTHFYHNLSVRLSNNRFIIQPGKLHAYNEGLWLRKRYDKFLGSHFSPDIFYLQTTAVDRAKMSGLLTAAGLWKPEGNQVWKSNLLWQPVPLDYQPLDQDTVRRLISRRHFDTILFY